MGLIMEEHRETIIESWRAAAPTSPALEFAIPVFVRELARSLRRGADPRRAWDRCALLVRKSGEIDPAAVVRELALLRRALWGVLQERRRAVAPASRLQMDAILDETTAAVVEALTRRSEKTGDT